MERQSGAVARARVPAGRLGVAGAVTTAAMVRKGVTVSRRVRHPRPAMAMTTRGPQDVKRVQMNTPHRLMAGTW